MIPDTSPTLRLNVEPTVANAVLLKGLAAWFKLGLMTELDWQYRRESDPIHQLTVVMAQNHQLLAGLEMWLELGILTETQIKWIGSTKLMCQVPVASPHPVTVPVATQRHSTLDQQTDLVPPPPPPARSPQSPNPVMAMVRSFVSEFSTMWLLFLGVFMVVVSSGLLAASQWSNFSPLSQYLLLLTYTLCFWGVSFWTNNQDRLRLTTRALQLVTLLLVPANFWAIDRLGLLTHPLTFGVSAIAGIVLSSVSIFLLQTSLGWRSEVAESATARSRHRLSRLTTVTILLLSWLHLGWAILPDRLIPLYLGVGGIAVVTFLNRRSRLNTADLSTFPLATLASSYGTGLLMARAVLFEQVSLPQLGLALGLWGWVLCQSAAKLALSTAPVPDSSAASLPVPLQRWLGHGLIAVGWLVAVGEPEPWQALAVSGVIAGVLVDRLRQWARPLDLTYLFGWGLQILWLGQRVVPETWQGSFTQQLLSLLHTNSPIALAGLGLFPYVLVTLAVAAFYRHRQQPQLADRAELLALGLGSVLMTLGSVSPVTRWINLTLSGLTLLMVQGRRAAASPDLGTLVYIAHIVSFGAITAGMWCIAPFASPYHWAGWLLATLLVEWGAVLALAKFNPAFSTPTLALRLRAWGNSAWHIGLLAAGASYVLLWQAPLRDRHDLAAIVTQSNWGVGWLIVPIVLTVLGSCRTFRDRDLAIQLSIVGLTIGQFLTFQVAGARLISLEIALALMLFNTRRHPAFLSALLTTGCGLTLIADLLWQFRIGANSTTQLAFGINGVIMSTMVLFGLSHWLKARRDHTVVNLNLPLNRAYAQAFDGWTAVLTTAFLLGQSLLAVIIFVDGWGAEGATELFLNLLLSTVLVLLGLVYRTWQEPEPSPVFWPQWGIAWSVELLASGAIVLTNGSIVELAIANLILGFVTQLLGDWWMRRSDSDEYPLSWDLVPLLYGLMGSLLRVGSFTHLSGLFTLGSALVGIGISRRSADTNPVFKALTYVSMVAATFSAYELLFYQMVSSSNGGSLGDGLVLLAALGCSLAYAYKLFSGWIMPYLKLSPQETEISAHLHWLASVGFVLSGSAFAPSSMGGMIGTGVTIALAAYALVQGRAQARSQHDAQRLFADGWVYVGVATVIGAGMYLFWFAVPSPVLIAQVLQPYGAAIGCSIAALLYYLPWARWGWSKRPWSDAALAVPLVLLGLTISTIAVPCLLIVAAFYGLAARLTDEIRLSYLTVGLLDWAIFQGWSGQGQLSSLTVACVMGFSGLYFVQVEPGLQPADLKPQRHVLRSVLTGGMCVMAWVNSFANPPMALMAWGLSLGFVLAGLGLRVRAYLLGGTLTFVVLVLGQAVTLVAQYAFLMWAIGIVAGIGFILVAANFEVRRDRILTLMRNLVNELEDWA